VYFHPFRHNQLVLNKQDHKSERTFAADQVQERIHVPNATVDESELLDAMEE